MPLISTLGAASSRGFGEFNQGQEKLYVEDVFSTYLYTGNGSTQTITNGIDLAGKGGMLWLKSRSISDSHATMDSAQGLGTNTYKYLMPNLTAATSNVLDRGVSQFNTNGFTLSNDNNQQFNDPSNTYVSWTFRKAPKFFDVVTYTGNGSTQNIAHNLGSVPGCMIVKRTDTTGTWAVYHRSLATNERLILESTAAVDTSATTWNNTAPTSTVFSVGFNTATNASGGTYVAYLFAHDTTADGIVQCGSYTGNGSSTGPVINLNWEPQYVLVKATGLARNWVICDIMRGMPVGSNGALLAANLSDAEITNDAVVQVNATGFQPRSTSSSTNDSSQNYIYLAIRRGPMRTPTDATKVFVPTVYTGTNVDNRLIDTTIAPDTVWVRQRNSTTVSGMVVGDRLRGQPYLLTGTNAAEVNDADSFDQQLVSATEYGTAFSSMNGVWVGNDATAQVNASTVANNQIAETFKRAPGFFDVVAYTGTGAAMTVSHNLSSVPELIILKKRNAAQGWFVYSSPTGVNRYLELQTTAAAATGNTVESAPTASTFNPSARELASIYIAYLFASCPGVSKVGSYTGTGTTQQIDCGFTSGARFVLIKRTDSTGDWYVWDSARGIIAGNDPYLLLNSIAAEVTSTDYVDTYSAGFELSSTAPAGLNEAFLSVWSTRSPYTANEVLCATYGNGDFVAGSNTGSIGSSIDGSLNSWTARTSSFGANAVRALSYGNGLFVAGGGAGIINTSSDSVTWTSRTSGTSSTIYAITYGNGIFVAGLGNGDVITSSDGITWTIRSTGFATYILGVAYGNGLFVIVGNSGKIFTSPDAITWTSRTSGVSSTLDGVTYGNGIFVTAGDSGVLLTSSDAITWTSRTSGFGTSTIRAVSFGSGTFVAGGADGKLTTSTDGITWTSRTSGFSSGLDIRDVTYGDGFFLAVGSSGTMTSTGSKYLYLAIA